MGDLLAMLVVAVLWAGAFIAGKLSVATVPPEIVAFLRFSIAGVILLAAMAVWERPSLQVKRRDWPLILGLAATGIAAYNLLFFAGLRFSSASDGAMIIPTLNPLLTLFLAAPILGEKLTARKLTGAGVALAGQMLIFGTMFAAAAHDPARLKGDLMCVVAALFWSSYSILGRIAAKRMTPLAATAWATAIGSVMLLPFALYQLHGTSGYGGSFWGEVIYMAIGSTVIAFFLWSRGLQRLGASRAAIFINLVPVFTLVLAALLLGERPGSLQVLGMVMVLGGVYLVSTVAKPAAAPSVEIKGESA